MVEFRNETRVGSGFFRYTIFDMFENFPADEAVWKISQAAEQVIRTFCFYSSYF